MRTLSGALRDAAGSGEGYTFIRNGVETRRSYAEIRQASFNMACALRKAGLAQGDLVALVIEDAEHFLTALFAGSIAGVIPASLAPPTVTGERSRYFELTGGSTPCAPAAPLYSSSSPSRISQRANPLNSLNRSSPRWTTSP
jgi:non-ribosomal peptide synthetase component E (peptide arylation enzyme)